jgi:hypothetical protein
MQKNNQSIAKKLFILGISIGSFLLSAPIQAESLTYKTKTSQVADSEFKGEIEVQIEEFKTQPTIVLVNKDLEIVAEFYGKTDKLKRQFEDAFENASLLASYQTQRIYLITQ